MQINKVTISGPDDKVLNSDLILLQKQYPFVEWGILISDKRAGTKRYPSQEWIKALHPGLNISFHLCGEIARNFVNNYQHNQRYQINGRNWSRIQLNFSFKYNVDFYPALCEIANTAHFNPKEDFILAYNQGSKKNLDHFIINSPLLPKNIHFLYDSSGGRGSELKVIEDPLINYTGYAGGLNPENVGSHCLGITKMKFDRDVWIDMESGVRTNDEFDLAKVDKVLSTCEKYMR